MPINPLSFDSQVAALKAGECVSKVRPIDPTETIEAIAQALPDLRVQMRNALAQPIARAKKRCGGQYSINVGETVMPDGSMYLVGIVKRTE